MSVDLSWFSCLPLLAHLPPVQFKWNRLEVGVLKGRRREAWGQMAREEGTGWGWHGRGDQTEKAEGRSNGQLLRELHRVEAASGP